ncbi:hypothetical protein LK542_03995 [Massilia sp. IC2-477]|uniref:hypothetical protein n=1 Tax=Massilia sp. IC2-477 TaxID=2887198 RepID=UPI001D12262A|nr:hypothetical protein [Massilia sp. IC2-477]MCC2954775.1 hypothetical protein [Massilia sp. IC2-477]
MLAAPGQETARELCSTIATAGFAAGFALWLQPVVLGFLQRRPGKLALAVIHAFLLLVSLAIARHVVAAATGLPPQDFDLTVGFVALACYLPAMALAATVATGIAALVFQLLFFARSLLRKPLRAVAMAAGHMTGALALVSLASQLLQEAERQHHHLYPTVRWIAYYSDYQAMPRYPGIAPGARVRLHENGVVSTATRQGGSVSIAVGRAD